MADAADVDVGGERVVLQERKRLSESVIWELQDAFYKDINIRSWSDRCASGGCGRRRRRHAAHSRHLRAGNGTATLLLRPHVHSAARCPFRRLRAGGHSCFVLMLSLPTTHAHSRNPPHCPLPHCHTTALSPHPRPNATLRHFPPLSALRCPPLASYPTS